MLLLPLTFTKVHKKCSTNQFQSLHIRWYVKCTYYILICHLSSIFAIFCSFNFIRVWAPLSVWDRHSQREAFTLQTILFIHYLHIDRRACELWNCSTAPLPTLEVTRNILRMNILCIYLIVSCGLLAMFNESRYNKS